MFSNINYLFELIERIGLPVLAFLLTRGLMIITGMRAELHVQNTRLIKLEEWRTLHDHIDESRFNIVDKDITALRLQMDMRPRR